MRISIKEALAAAVILGAAFSSSCGAGAAALTDGEVAYIYLQANLFEVEKAELGKSLGTSDDVKKHGEMVATDHRGVVKMFQHILELNHIKPTETANSAATVAAHQALMTDLKAKTGAEFDKAYLTHEAANHKGVIEAIRGTLLPAAKSEAIVKHFNEVLPAFEHHLAMTLDALKRAGLPEPK